jgi:hypothetical protein
VNEQIATYMGKLLEDMTKEELIEAVKNLGHLYSERLKESLRQIDVLCGSK